MLQRIFMIIIKRYIITIALIQVTIGHGMNLLSPYDTLIRSRYDVGYRANATWIQEFGFSPIVFGNNGTVASPLQLWQCDVNGLAMLKGFPTNSPITQLYNTLNANDNGTRGHIVLNGRLENAYMSGFTSRIFFHRDWFFEADLPIYHMRLTDITLCDNTASVTAADLRVKNLFTNQFAEVVNTLGCLNINQWNRTGCGDLTLLMNWFRDFPQHKIILRNARVNGRLGLSIPTGRKVDEDALFAFAYGNDGAVGLPFGLGLDLNLIGHVKVGLDVQLIQSFGNVRERRIKTNKDQSDLILLQKTLAYKDFGMIQRLNLYVAADQLAHCLSLSLGYQYWKHGEDRLILCSNAYSNAIANTAESLRDRTYHLLIVNAQYDGATHFCPRYGIRPYISAFSRIPFNGKRMLLNHTIGMVVAIDF